jgi:hypothetical protein
MDNIYEDLDTFLDALDKLGSADNAEVEKGEIPEMTEADLTEGVSVIADMIMLATVLSGTDPHTAIKEALVATFKDGINYGIKYGQLAD